MAEYAEVGLLFLNSKDEMCQIKSITNNYVYVELLDSDNEHYKIDLKNIDKYFKKGRYKPVGYWESLLYG